MVGSECGDKGIGVLVREDGSDIDDGWSGVFGERFDNELFGRDEGELLLNESRVSLAGGNENMLGRNGRLRADEGFLDQCLLGKKGLELLGFPDT